MRLYSKAHSWPRATAKIISKNVVPRKVGSSARAAFTTSVEYVFSVNGINRTGKKVFLVELLKGERGFMKKSAQKFIDKMPDEVQIFYNPDNEEESVVYCDGLLFYIFALVFGFFMLLIGFAMYFS